FQVLGDIKDKTILDIGCGSGPYIVEALRRDARLVTGVDAAANMLALTRARLNNGSTRERFRLVKGLFPAVALEPHDHAIVMGVMDYVPDALSFLTTLCPLIRGTAAVSFPSKHWFRTPLRRLRYWLRRCPVYFYDETEIRRLGLDAGFTRVDIKKIP